MVGILANKDSNGVKSDAMDHIRPKVLVPEKVSPDGLALLQKTLDVEVKQKLSEEEIHKIIPDYEALIVRSETKVTKSLLDAGKNLKVVARAGVGVDNVDVEHATKLGIIVVNSPSGNIGAAAEHTIALLLAVARNVPDACASLKAGKWERSRLVGVEVKNKTLAVIGLGKVGLSVARFANGLGMNVEALDPYASPAIAQAANVSMVSSLGELLPQCDFLTIHTPLIASTKGMIGASELASMKKGARILNVARGGMIDETALVEALDSGHIAGAGIDVFTSEPPTENSTASKLIAHPKVVATPHLGASTVEAQENVSIDVCQQVLAILSGDLPRSAVNAPMILPEEYKTLHPFVRLIEKMGSLYTQYYSGSKSSLGSRTTFDLVYEGTLATLTNTKPLYAALVKGLTAPVTSENVNIVNADLVAKERGIVVNEQKSRSPPDPTYASMVILRARPTPRSRATSPWIQRHQTSVAQKKEEEQEQQICGYVSGGQIYISRLDRFNTSFWPEGNLIICHNYNSPGKIGVVGGILGKEGVNIQFMTVAPIDMETIKDSQQSQPQQEEEQQQQSRGEEALMILGVDKEISREVKDRIASEQGILEVRLAAL